MRGVSVIALALALVVVPMARASRAAIASPSAPADDTPQKSDTENFADYKVAVERLADELSTLRKDMDAAIEAAESSPRDDKVKDGQGVDAERADATAQARADAARKDFRKRLLSADDGAMAAVAAFNPMKLPVDAVIPALTLKLSAWADLDRFDQILTLLTNTGPDRHVHFQTAAQMAKGLHASDTANRALTIRMLGVPATPPLQAPTDIQSETRALQEYQEIVGRLGDALASLHTVTRAAMDATLAGAKSYKALQRANAQEAERRAAKDPTSEGSPTAKAQKTAEELDRVTRAKSLDAQAAFLNALRQFLDGSAAKLQALDVDTLPKPRRYQAFQLQMLLIRYLGTLDSIAETLRKSRADRSMQLNGLKLSTEQSSSDRLGTIIKAIQSPDAPHARP